MLGGAYINLVFADEEEYFGEGDDEDDIARQPTAQQANGLMGGLRMDFPLVDYADDEEDPDPATQPG